MKGEAYGIGTPELPDDDNTQFRAALERNGFLSDADARERYTTLLLCVRAHMENPDAFPPPLYVGCDADRALELARCIVGGLPLSDRARLVPAPPDKARLRFVPDAARRKLHVLPDSGENSLFSTRRALRNRLERLGYVSYAARALAPDEFPAFFHGLARAARALGDSNADNDKILKLAFQCHWDAARRAFSDTPSLENLTPRELVAILSDAADSGVYSAALYALIQDARERVARLGAALTKPLQAELTRWQELYKGQRARERLRTLEQQKDELEQRLTAQKDELEQRLTAQKDELEQRLTAQKDELEQQKEELKQRLTAQKEEYEKRLTAVKERYARKETPRKSDAPSETRTAFNAETPTQETKGVTDTVTASEDTDASSGVTASFQESFFPILPELWPAADGWEYLTRLRACFLLPDAPRGHEAEYVNALTALFRVGHGPLTDDERDFFYLAAYARDDAVLRALETFYRAYERLDAPALVRAYDALRDAARDDTNSARNDRTNAARERTPSDSGDAFRVRAYAERLLEAYARDMDRPWNPIPLELWLAVGASERRRAQNPFAVFDEYPDACALESDAPPDAFRRPEIRRQAKKYVRARRVRPAPDSVSRRISAWLDNKR